MTAKTKPLQTAQNLGLKLYYNQSKNYKVSRKKLIFPNFAEFQISLLKLRIVCVLQRNAPVNVNPALQPNPRIVPGLEGRGGAGIYID